MTFAPQSIVDARAYMLSIFDMHPGNVDSDLDPTEVGIVGDTAHRGGYHCGSDRTVSGDYSVVESPRDRHPTLAASALDLGWFSAVIRGKTATLRTFSTWLVAECQRGAPDTLDIREVIYSPDGKIVRRWDRLGKRTTGDTSHLSHTHISYFRDSEARTKVPIFVRFVQSLGEDMDSNQDLMLKQVHAILRQFYWQWAPDRAEFISKGGDPATWDFMGGLSDNEEGSANRDTQTLQAIKNALPTLGGLTVEDRATIQRLAEAVEKLNTTLAAHNL